MSEKPENHFKEMLDMAGILQEIRRDFGRIILTKK